MSHRPGSVNGLLHVGDYAPLSTSEGGHVMHHASMQSKIPRMPFIPTTWREKGNEILQDDAFQIFMAVLIIANSIVIGLETDFKGLAIWSSVETVFLFVFLTEFLFKLVCGGFHEYFRFTGEDVHWNLLDFAIVGLGLVEFITKALLSTGNSIGGTTVFRMLRLMRILRIFRIVRFLKQLYMLAYGLALAATAIVWVTVLMAFVLYVCAIILVRTVGRMPPDAPGHDLLSNSFDTIPRSMFTLFNLMAQPDLTPFKDVLPDYPLLGLFLIFFTIFGSFGMIALLTGVIGESMFEKNQLRMEEERAEGEQRRKLLLDICQSMFDNIPHINGTQVDKRNIERLIPDLQSLFDSEKISYASHEFESMLNAMDKNGDGFVSKEEFSSGILQIAEGVRPISIIEIHCETVECLSQVLQLRADVDKCLGHLEGGIKLSTAAQGTSRLEEGRREDCDAAVAELRSLILELSGEVQLVARVVQTIAETQTPGVTTCISQLAGLRENVDKCLGYHEEGASCSTNAGIVGLKGSLLSLEGILLDLRHDVQLLSQRPMPTMQNFANFQPQLSEKTSLRWEVGASLDVLQTKLRGSVEGDHAARVEAQLDAKIDGVVQTLVERLAQKMELCSSAGLGGLSGAGCCLAEEKLGRAEVKAGFNMQQSRNEAPLEPVVPSSFQAV